MSDYERLTTQVRKTLMSEQLEALLFSMAYEIEELKEKVRELRAAHPTRKEPTE